MSALTQIESLAGDIAEAYDAVAEMGGTVPEAGGSVGLADAIRSILKGEPSDLRTISILPNDPEMGNATGGGMAQDGVIMTVSAEAANGHRFNQWSENGEPVSSSRNYTFEVSRDRNLTAVFAPYRIYGVEWDGTSTTKWTRTDDSDNFVDPVPYVAGATNYGSPFDNLQPWAGMQISERTGGTMVSIPKFWYKITQNGKGMKIQIADKSAPGFSVSPAHMNRGDGKGERDVVYIGRYHCHTSDWKSKTGGKPKASVTRATARSSIHALGSNIWQADFAMRFTLWLLYIVEFSDWNTQKTIGNGCGNNSGTENMGYTDNMPYHTGTTQSSRDTYGLGTQYRWIEGLWDNVGDWCDGCYNASSGLMIILNPNNFSDSSGGTSAGTPPNGYPSAFAVSSSAGFEMFIPTAESGSETTYSCDHWGFNASYPCVYVGGIYTQYGYFGLFYFGFDTASISLNYVGSRLQELP